MKKKTKKTSYVWKENEYVKFEEIYGNDAYYDLGYDLCEAEIKGFSIYETDYDNGYKDITIICRINGSLLKYDYENIILNDRIW